NNEVDIFKGWEKIESVLMSHGDKVTRLGDGFSVIAETVLCPNAAVKHDEKPFYGVQFHPESKHTQNGEQFLKNFI
ncbi:GMP synthase (glutamine-hydrolyzing), partial [Staphylococcus aureus]|nr:GMP synthase (glutamine-hydrolyzing) [Staphylococcus aureus]